MVITVMGRKLADSTKLPFEEIRESARKMDNRIAKLKQRNKWMTELFDLLVHIRRCIIAIIKLVIIAIFGYKLIIHIYENDWINKLFAGQLGFIEELLDIAKTNVKNWQTLLIICSTIVCIVFIKQKYKNENEGRDNMFQPISE